jgi:hypothetical protein
VPNSGGDYAFFRPDDTAVFDARYRRWKFDDGTSCTEMQSKGFLLGREPGTMDRLRQLGAAWRRAACRMRRGLPARAADFRDEQRGRVT